MTLLRILETVHGHLAILAAAALIHPAISLRRGRPMTRGRRWSVALTTLFVVLAFGTGVAIYGDYREVVRRDLWLTDPVAGLLFETKEHIAWAVLTLSLGAGAAAFVAPKDAREMRQAAAIVYAVAAAICIVTIALGTYVAAVRSFPY